MNRRQKAIDSILSDLRYHFTEVKKGMKRRNHEQIVDALKSARRCRESLEEYMPANDARKLYYDLHDEVLEVKREKDER